MITGEHQSSSKVSVKACSLSPTQQPHRTGDDLLQQLSVQGIPRDTLSSGEFITLSSQGTEHDIMQAVYSRTSATALCCGLDSTGSRVYKSDCWVQAPNSCWPNKKLLDDLGKIYYQKSMKEFIYWKKKGYSVGGDAILTWTWQQPEGLWRGRGVALGSAGLSSVARGHQGGKSCCGTWRTAQGDMPPGWWGRSSLPCKRKQRE